VPAGRVRGLAEVYAWDQALSQGLRIEVAHASLGTLALPGPPLRFDDNAYAGAGATHRAPPRLGEHDASVRAWLNSL
jgi:crotonobetainyl-CoA:carnitine CoA-transferase CaiB-like acyl-CoA transferase